MEKQDWLNNGEGKEEGADIFSILDQREAAANLEEEPAKTEKEFGGEFFKEDFSEPESDDERLNVDRRIIEKEAKTTVFLLDMVNARLAGFVSKSDFERYKIKKSESEELTVIMADYMEATGFKVNIHAQFWGAILGVFGSVIYRAYEDGEQSKKIVQRKEVITKMQAGETVTKEEVATVKKEDLSLRKRFEIDSDGFYRWDVNGVYIKGAKVEKPSPEIMNIIERMKDGEATEGQINQACRNFLNNA